MRKILSLVSILILLSCSKETNMKSNKEIFFKVGYQPVSFLSGYYEEENLLYFTDPATTQQIKLFDLQGNLQDSISLKAVIGQYPELTDIHIFSLDTIVVTSRYINRIYVLNRKGEIWKQLDLNDQVIDEEKNKYWLWGSLHPSFQDKEQLLYYAEWRGNLEDKKKGRVPHNMKKNREYFIEKSYDSYIFTSVEGLFSEKPKLRFGFKNYHHQISDKPYYTVGHSFFNRVKNKVYLFGRFSNDIFIVDFNSMELIDKINVNSAYSSIGIEPIITEEQFENCNKDARKKGVIEKILYDEVKGEFYVILTKETEEDKEGYYWPFIVQLYDKNFKLIGEKEFGAGKYSPFIAYFVEGELMLYKKNNNINSLKNGEQIFEFFTFK